jgi:hypothetical protein
VDDTPAKPPRRGIIRWLEQPISAVGTDFNLAILAREIPGASPDADHRSDIETRKPHPELAIRSGDIPLDPR